MQSTRRRWRDGLLALALATLAVVARAGEVKVALEAPDEVAPLLKQHVRLLNMAPDSFPDAAPDRAALVRRARAEISDLLATEGYFSPTVRIDRDDATRWKLIVTPGERVTVTAVDISFVGDIATDAGQEARRDGLRAGWKLPLKAPFRQADWDDAKNALLDALRGERYPAAKLTTTRADIDSDAAAARLTVAIDSGPAFRLGKLEVSGLETLPVDFVARFNTLNEGDYYKRGDLLKFQEALQGAPQFSVVVVSVDPDPAQAAAAPVRVTVREAQPQRLGFGLGASSNTGYRIETSYRHVNLFSRGWELSSGLRLEQRRQSLYTDLFLPPQHDARIRDSVGVGFERSDLEGLKIHTEAIGVARAHRHDNIESQLTARVQHETIEPDGAERSSYDTLTLNWVWIQRAVDEVLDPRNGYVLEVQLGGGIGLSSQAKNFGRVYGRYQHYFAFGAANANVLSLRAEGGITIAETRAGIPQDFLFRAGGTQSVRGFAYRSLGVEEGSAIVGGRYLVTGSVEYVRWVKPTMGLALFVDSGNANDDRELFTYKTGFGLGGRWMSPAGPLAVDIAWGRHERRPRLHFGVAVAF
ncbi:MAG: BamA/TamA family outer membrane protein [Azoarcus sp.]|jgi:translocation and assembly module TamA|nr:BamA/TamA family outer membrane protein [Azoarcus sp.]